MNLLIDSEILKRVRGSRPAVKGVPAPADWESYDSPVQPASLDLHIGDIFIPGARADEPGGEKSPVEELTLSAGETAMVVTLEILDFPDELTAFGFPPARISSRGILMTNPGHIDPGYTGPMRFTLINMGREPFVVRTGDAIATLLFVSLNSPPAASYRARIAGRAPKKIAYEELRRLSRDFLDFQVRATKIAKEEVAKAELEVKRAQARLPFWAAIVAAIITGVITYFSAQVNPAWREPLQNLESKVSELSAQVSVSDLRHRIDSLEAEIKAHEARRASLPKGS